MNRDLSPTYISVILLLFFFSGLATLIYEVLWMKELGLLFGNTAYASATTLAAFFLGLALGGYFWGQHAIKLENPLHTYGLLEIAVVISVTGYFLILDGFYALYPTLFAKFGQTTGLFIAVKFALAILVLFPPAFLLGGTLPVISQYVVQGTRNIGLRVSMLYGINTFGAAVGALLAGFYLPQTFGYAQTYWIAMACTGSVGFVALIMAKNLPTDSESSSDPKPTAIESRSLIAIPFPTIKAVVFLSGFGTLCLQVLWTPPSWSYLW